MAKIQKKTKVASNPKRKPSAARKGTATKKNPQKKNHAHKTSRNPFPALGGLKAVLINIGTGFVSAVATRQLPQMVLNEKNEGVLGYFANAATGLAVTLLANQFISTPAAISAVTGSGVIIADRLITENMSPVGKYLSLSGIGDPAAVSQMRGLVKNGLYVRTDENGDPIIPKQYTDAAIDAFRQLQPPPGASSMAGLTPSNRFASRFSN